MRAINITGGGGGGGGGGGVVNKAADMPCVGMVYHTFFSLFLMINNIPPQYHITYGT